MSIAFAGVLTLIAVGFMLVCGGAITEALTDFRYDARAVMTVGIVTFLTGVLILICVGLASVWAAAL